MPLILEFEGHPPPPPPPPVDPIYTEIPRYGDDINPVVVFEVVATGQTDPCPTICRPKIGYEVTEAGRPPFHRTCRCYTEMVTMRPRS